MRIMPRARYCKNSMNNHVKGVDVEVIKVIQLVSDHLLTVLLLSILHQLPHEVYN